MSEIPGSTAPALAERVSPYVPRMLQVRLFNHPGERYWTADGTAVLVDITGFTSLSERLARKGREGSEQIAEAIGQSFESILLVAYQNGASLLKFGGDSLLLWFDDPDHVLRGCRACLLMRRALRTAGRIVVPGARTSLRMSQGVHSGRFHFFAVGSPHYELLPVGPAWTSVVAMESAAGSGEIVVSAPTAAMLPERCLGGAKDGGRLLVRDPFPRATELPLTPRPALAPEELARCLPERIRAHVQRGGGMPDHRPVTVAFVRIEGADASIEREGPARVAEVLAHVVDTVCAAAGAHGVTVLGSDVDTDGAKLILTAGAPAVIGDDEERMLLALRAIADAPLALPVRIGVNRGAVFAGDIGPFYRRTYSVMGDVVNIAARLMAKAAPGAIYATADVLDRSDTVFATTELSPLAVKGKAQPVRAWSVGRATGSRAREVGRAQLPLVGRDGHLAILREALAQAREGRGCLVDVTGEAGVGKTRLLEALREEARGLRTLHVTCEAYTTSTPYVAWGELVRELLGIGREEPEALLVQRLRDFVDARMPDSRCWMPLLAAAFGVDEPPTPEVEELAEKNRRPKLHEVAGRYLELALPDATLVEFENVHCMDEASAELLAYVAGSIASRPWLFAIARRPSARAVVPENAAAVKIALDVLAKDDALRLARIATEADPLPMHALDVIAKRSAGNPQFLRDLVRAAMETGGIDALPDSAEAAAAARIDALTPEDRAWVRRAAVLGLTFHPRMLEWFAGDDEPPPDAAAWERWQELFDVDHEGYCVFRRSLLRDAAYQGLPFKLRRRLHGIVAQRLQEDAVDDEEASILSLHYMEAGEFAPAWRNARAAARRAESVFAYVEAATLFQRAVDAGRKVPGLPRQELAVAYDALGDCWLRASEFHKATAAYAIARRMNVDGDRLLESSLLLKHSRLEEKLGQYPKALRWAARARSALRDRADTEAVRLVARASAWYATLLQLEGRTQDAVRWAERTVAEAQPVGDDEALGAAYLVLGWACGAQGKPGAERNWQLALEAFERSGNLARQPALLINLGLACQWDGRWDEALDYYERGRADNVRIGNHVNATLARLNIAEILTDRGQWQEAEALLTEILPFWKAAKYRYFLGACLSLLGRLSLRAGRLDEATARLEDAKAKFLQIGAADEVPAVDARIAECFVYQGRTGEALDIVSAMLARAASSNPIRKLESLLHRVLALAHFVRGDIAKAREAAEASVRVARSRNENFEAALSFLLLAEIDSSASFAREAQELLAPYNVREVPRLPVSSLSVA